jgi:rhodanese-related sulfurtransferase
VAQQLMDLGFLRVNPVLGGFTAWRNAGYPVEP